MHQFMIQRHTDHVPNPLLVDILFQPFFHSEHTYQLFSHNTPSATLNDSCSAVGFFRTPSPSQFQKCPGQIRKEFETYAELIDQTNELISVHFVNCISIRAGKHV